MNRWLSGLRWIVWGFRMAFCYLPKRGLGIAIKFVVTGLQWGLATFMWKDK